jgi:DNA-binding transcriptional LysR family regulator
MGELRVFVAVLEHRSFRKAAAAIHLSQPAVTKAIAGLEDMLGVKLFDRTAGGVEPTVSRHDVRTARDRHLRLAAQRRAGHVAGVAGCEGNVADRHRSHAGVRLPARRDQAARGRASQRLRRSSRRADGTADRLRKREIEIAILRTAFNPATTSR